MAVTVQDILNLGFSADMFSPESEPELESIIKEVIAVQGAILSGRIGSESYNDKQAPVVSYVRRALICLCGAEMCSLRINAVLSTIQQSSDQDETAPIRKQKKDYQREAEKLIDLIEAEGQASDYAASVVISRSDAVLRVPERGMF
ncbi:MAG: hypothetical protein GY874_14320 [Desulfobacteraceae bacterium]|nr:hypothetical protein [Desulfobacteraceae bacterium]